MKTKIYFTFILFVFSILQISVSAQNQKDESDYSDKRKKAELLEYSCKKNNQASCFELGLVYQSFKEAKFKYDGIEYNKIGQKFIVDACKNGERAACDYLKGEELYEGSKLLYWSSIILIGISVLMVTQMMFQDNEAFQAQQKLEDGEDVKSQKANNQGIVLQYSRPFFKRYFSPVVAQMKNKKQIKEKYKRKLASAGLTDVLTTEDFFAFKLFLILGFPILFFVIRYVMEESWPLSYVPFVALIGFIYPDFWIKGKIEQRQKALIGGMPFSVDMLALAVEAGLDFIAAMTKVVEKAKPGPLTEEFEILIKEIKIGASRAEALRNMAWRANLIPISSFCATLIAADSVGASIGPILKALSIEIRQKKSAQIEKEGATAATKILFPMMAFILPAVLLMVFAPMLIDMLGGGK